MWARWIGVIPMVVVLAGCANGLPEKVALLPQARSVEIIDDAPNLEVYEPAGEVSARVIGRDVRESRRQTEFALRNQAGAKGASFVLIEDAASQASWDGRTISSASGTAFRSK